MSEFLNQSVEFLKYAFDFFLHLDKHLSTLVSSMGGWTYAILFLVIFAETGLVVTPFLPGDSLLFAVGAIAALPDANLNIWLLIALLFIAAVLGDAVNYSVGRWIGPRVFRSDTHWLLNREHLNKTQTFYEKYGGKTIIIARFIPIIRTFAPFVAGVGNMSYARFASYNVIGAFVWVLPFSLAGYFLGNLPFVKDSFHYIIVAIIIISVMPAVIEVMKSRRQVKKSDEGYHESFDHR